MGKNINIRAMLTIFLSSQAANEEAVAKTAEVFKEGETNLAILIMYAPTNKRQMS